MQGGRLINDLHLCDTHTEQLITNTKKIQAEIV